MRTLWLSLLLCLIASPVLAQENSAPAPSTNVEPVDQSAAKSSIPTAETDFIQNINQYDKDAIVAQFGEPASKNDYHRAGTDELMASVWQYHYINTDLEGSFYQTTELDFVGDNVVMVVFMNHDGIDTDPQRQPVKPDL